MAGSSAVSDSDRQRLHSTFEQLCRIASPTGEERGVADWITRDLIGLGLDVQEDDAGAAVGSDAGNLLARLPGRTDRSLLFCAHMDTVPLTAPVEPVRRDDGWENANDGILGADNKAAVAAMLELARVLVSRDSPPEVGLELLFTVAEETGLNGAREFDVGRLASSFGYVFDHASPIGEVITASPTQMRIDGEVRGRAAHAGLQPELGVSAILAAAHAITNMPQGRFDQETTANIGIVAGGTATNVVPDRCSISAEVRAVEREQVDRYVTQAIDALQDAADTAGCDLDLKVQQLFTGYRTGNREAPVVLAAKALRRLGYEPSYRSSGGGSDANAFRLNGFPCTNLANGTERAHERTERVSFVALDGNLELMLALIDESTTMEAGRDHPGGDLTQFEVVAETVQWQGRLLKAGTETYRYADGSENTFDKVWHPGAVAIVPYDNQYVWLVRQPRPASGQQASLEIPAGKRDRVGEPLLDLAKRELAEEIGKQARQWREVLSFHPTPGFCDEQMTMFVATDLSDARGGPAPEADEYIEVVPWPLSDLDSAIAATTDAKTLVGLLWLARELEHR